jgi:hypothetical protein
MMDLDELRSRLDVSHYILAFTGFAVGLLTMWLGMR